MKAIKVMNILNISRSTLSKYVKEKKIHIRINKHNGRYVYDPKSVYELASNYSKNNVIYARVSTYKQKSQLENQINKIKNYCSNNSIIINNIYKDISSGLSLNRKYFENMSNLVLQYNIDTIYITNKDRLFRLSFNILKQLFAKYGTKIVCINEYNVKTEEEELISLIHCFSMKSYSKRCDDRQSFSLHLFSKIKVALLLLLFLKEEKLNIILLKKI